jgi:preprotein translocase subunit YajC
VNTGTLILQAAAPGGGMMPIFLMVGMFVVMYFFMIRPQAKRAKEQKKFSEDLTSGEQIVTTAGIHARVNRANEDGTLQIEISRGSFMTIERSAVSMELTAALRKKASATTEVAAK